MLNKGIQKIINSFLSVLLALTCINVYTVTADDDTTAIAETPVATEAKDLDELDVNSTEEITEASEETIEEVEPTEEATVETEEAETVETQQEETVAEEPQQVEVTQEESSEQALDLNSLTTDELFAYIMSIDADALDALYDEYANLDELMANFSDEQNAQLAEKFGNGEENIETAGSASFSPTIQNAEVVYFAYHTTSDTDNITFTPVTGSFTLNSYTTNSKPGYILFFVKGAANHLITNLGASGSDNIYPVDSSKSASDYTSIKQYPNLTKVIKAAEDLGYVGVFGYCREKGQNISDVVTFTVKGQSPNVTVTATSNKYSDVKPGDKIVFTVTVTPEIIGNISVDSVVINSATINGKTVEITDFDNNTYTGKISYTATKEDCESGNIELKVNATTKYICSVSSTGDGDEVYTYASIVKDAKTDCSIANQNQVKYKFVSSDANKQLDDEVNGYLPIDSSSYYNGETVKVKNPSKESVPVSNGVWHFDGWNFESKNMTDDGVTFIGTWTFEESDKYTVTYVVEGDAPTTYKGEIPATQEYYEGTTVTVADVLTTDEKNLSDGTRGTWTFTWDKTGSFELTENTTIKGTWTFKENKKASEAGYYLVLDNATWSNGQPEGTYQSSNANKYFYTNKFASGDSFNVTDKVPAADGYAFIGWFDKERNGQAATIREAGAEVTINYNSKDTYCLDALWATATAKGYTGTYDGQEHTITDEISFASGKNWDAKYGDDARNLITVNSTEYKTENSEWSTTKPTFKDAGTYTVYVKKSITVGEKTYTLETSAQVVINQKAITVTADNKEKTYGEADPTLSASVNGLVEGDSIDYSLSRESGENAGTYTINVAGQASQGNYTVTYKEGTLTIKASQEKITVTVTGNSDEVTYDGNLHTVEGYTVTGTEDTDIKLTAKSEALASGVNAGTYNMGLSEDSFTVESNNYSNIELVVVDGKLTIKASKYTVENPSDVTYNGESQKQSPVIKDGDKVLEEGKDYELKYSEDTTNAGTVTVTVIGKGNYEGCNSEVTYKINQKAITVTADNKEKTYGEADPTLSASVNGLVEGDSIDYSLSRESGENAGTYTINVAGQASQGNYTVTYKEGTLTIKASQEKITVTVTGNSDEVTYDGNLHTVEGYTVTGTEDTDIKLTAKSEALASGVNAGTYNMGLSEDSFTVESNNYSNIELVVVDGKLTIKASKYTVENPSDVTYNGESQKQSPVIKDGDKVLEEGKDYELKYSEDTTNAGTVTVTVIGKGNYEGTIETTYTINKATLNVTTNSATRSYNGEALTAEGKVTGLVNGETTTVKTTGSQTEVGSSVNTYELVWESAKASNYDVKEELGTLTVTESKEVTPTPTPTPDNNDGGNNNGGNDNSGNTDVVPTPSPAPVNPTPAPTPTVEPSDSEVTPSEVIPEEETNTVEPSTDTETIDDDATPENGSKKKAWALINLICAVASMLLGIALLFSKREKDDDEDDSNPNNVQMTTDEQDEESNPIRYRRWKVVAVIDAIISIVLFILTENITLPMVLVDKWTLLMFALTCVNIVSLILGRRFHDQDEKEEQAQ